MSKPVSASLFDFGLYLFHGGRAALEAGTGPYFYLPKLESHLEARSLERRLRLSPRNASGFQPEPSRRRCWSRRCLAAFEMDEILYELREHSAGLNAGRWDYIFSIIKKLRTRRRLRACPIARR